MKTIHSILMESNKAYAAYYQIFVHTVLASVRQHIDEHILLRNTLGLCIDSLPLDWSTPALRSIVAKAWDESPYSATLPPPQEVITSGGYPIVAFEHVFEDKWVFTTEPKRPDETGIKVFCEIFHSDMRSVYIRTKLQSADDTCILVRNYEEDTQYASITFGNFKSTKFNADSQVHVALRELGWFGFDDALIVSVCKD